MPCFLPMQPLLIPASLHHPPVPPPSPPARWSLTPRMSPLSPEATSHPWSLLAAGGWTGAFCSCTPSTSPSLPHSSSHSCSHPCWDFLPSCSFLMVSLLLLMHVFFFLNLAEKWFDALGARCSPPEDTSGSQGSALGRGEPGAPFLQEPRCPHRDASPRGIPFVSPLSSHRAAGLLVAAPGPCVGVRGSVRAPPSPPREEIPPCAPQGCSFMSASGSISTSLQPGVVGGSCRQGPPLSPIVPLHKDSFGAGVCSRREKPSGFPRPTLTGKVDGASSMVSLPVSAGQRFWG